MLLGRAKAAQQEGDPGAAEEHFLKAAERARRSRLYALELRALAALRRRVLQPAMRDAEGAALVAEALKRIGKKSENIDERIRPLLEGA